AVMLTPASPNSSPREAIIPGRSSASMTISVGTVAGPACPLVRASNPIASSVPGVLARANQAYNDDWEGGQTSVSSQRPHEPILIDRKSERAGTLSAPGGEVNRPVT